MTEPTDERRLLAARYLAGMLSPADALRFEESVRADPALVDELRLGEQVARASRLIDVERLGEKPPWWHERRVPVTAAVVIVVLLVAATWFAVRAGIAEDRMAMLEEKAAAGFLLPPSTTRSVRVDPGGGLTIGGSATPERVEIRVPLASNDFSLFRVSVARDDGTAVLHADRLQRDSNNELRIALNSTLLPAGNYALRIEGFTWRGETVPVGRVELIVAG